MQNENDFENALAKYPELIEDGLQLIDRQMTVYGRRMDLVFSDRFQRKLITELKWGPIKDAHVGQIMAYEGMLLSSTDPSIRIMLIGTRVPPNLRLSLDHHGIAWKEITSLDLIGFLRSKNDVDLLRVFEDAAALPLAAFRPATVPTMKRPREVDSTASQVETGPTVTTPSPLHWSARGYDLVLVNRETLDSHKLAELIQEFEDAVPSCRNARVVATLRNWAADPRSVLPLSECQSLLRWVITRSWRNAVPAADALWAHLFGRPAPTWQTWNGSRYDFDYAGWKRWYASLPH